MAKADILVVEDESIVARDLANRLKRLDYHVTGIAASGEDAIGKAVEAPPDLVLMDIMLRGDMDGIEAAGQIWERLGVPVVYLTANSDENTLQRAKITGPFGYILKPFEERSLYTTIEMALYKHQIEDELRRHRDQLEEMVEERTAELTKANEALQESEERYRTLIETSPDAIMLADMDDKLIMANQEAARIHGYESPEEMMSSVTSTFELIAPEDRPRAVENVQKTVEQGRLGDVEYTFLRKDGSTFPAELSASLIRNGGSTPKAFIAVTRDITERKEIEDRSQQQERLAAVGQLAAGIAHDFNNILTGIIGYAQLLNMHPDIPEPVKEDLASIEVEGQRAAHLIRQVLDFSRQSVMRRQSLDLVPFLKESLKFLKRTIPENVHIFMEMGSDEYLVQADPTQIQQVVTNLAVNARDAMPRGGELRFKLSSLRPDSSADLPLPDMPIMEWVVLEVSDTGTGIPPEIRSRIFDPFFTTKEVGEGTGLGLAQVYGIVMQHDGFVDLQSEMGQGTTFRVYLPKQALGGVLQQDSEEQTEIPHGTETVMLVEDEPLVLNVGQEILTSLGYTVLSATNGEEAVEIYEERADEIDLVVMDMVMPGMDGQETYQALVQINPEVRVVLISGYSLSSSIEELWSWGIRDFIQKPFRYPVLARAVRNVLDDEE